jgi:hypothetical protein
VTVAVGIACSWRDCKDDGLGAAEHDGIFRHDRYPANAAHRQPGTGQHAAAKDWNAFVKLILKDDPHRKVTAKQVGLWNNLIDGADPGLCGCCIKLQANLHAGSKPADVSLWNLNLNLDPIEFDDAGHQAAPGNPFSLLGKAFYDPAGEWRPNGVLGKLVIDSLDGGILNRNCGSRLGDLLDPWPCLSHCQCGPAPPQAGLGLPNFGKGILQFIGGCGASGDKSFNSGEPAASVFEAGLEPCGISPGLLEFFWSRACLQFSEYLLTPVEFGSGACQFNLKQAAEQFGNWFGSGDGLAIANRQGDHPAVDRTANVAGSGGEDCAHKRLTRGQIDFAGIGNLHGRQRLLAGGGCADDAAAQQRDAKQAEKGVAASSASHSDPLNAEHGMPFLQKIRTGCLLAKNLWGRSESAAEFGSTRFARRHAIFAHSFEPTDRITDAQQPSVTRSAFCGRSHAPS